MGVAAAEAARTRRLHAVVLAAVLAAGTAVVVAGLSHAGADRDWLVLGGFTAGLALAQLFPIHLVHRDQSEALQVEEAFLVPLLLLVAPLDVLLVVVVSTSIASLAWRRGAMKAVFNVAATTACAGSAIGAAALVDPSVDAAAGGLLAALVGALAYCVTSAVAVSVIISTAQAMPFRAVLLDGALVRVATWAGSLSLGTLAALSLAHGREGLLAAAVPVVLLQAAYAGALRQWRERRRADALYAAAARIRDCSTSAEVRSEVVDAARALLEAGGARLVARDEPVGPDALRAPLDETTALEVAERATDRGRWTSADESRLQVLAGVASSALSQALLHEQMQSITRSLGEGVLAVDDVGAITFANPAAEQLLGYGPGGLLGKDVVAVDPPIGQPEGTGWVHLPRVRAGQTLRLDEHVVSRADGRPVDVALTASPVVREGEVVGAVVVFRDVRERMALERRLVHQAFHDPLTGLPNRALFLDRLEHARKRSRERSDVQAVLFVDLDRFKVVNDSLGHRVGDEVLVTVASRMVGVLRDGDTVARFGGDEFTVLLEELASADEAAQAAERIVQALRVPLVAGDREVVLSASIGIAVAEPGNEPGDLLAAADIAMYEAKSAGKDRWSVASAGADDRALARLDLEVELRRALGDGELEVHYQPVVHTDGGDLYGMEALVRWRHPALGLLSPSAFMELAEDTGLVLPLGEWVLERVCRDGRAWLDRHPGSPAVFAVNLSARQFAQPDLRDRVADVLDRTGFDPSHLVLEITETVVMRDTEQVLRTLSALRGLRLKLAVDDFGTGFSSLSYLKRFPVDTIKIDKSFVDGLGTSAVDREIVTAVVRLARAVGMLTVAEGVETTRQLDQLRLLGCDAVQGFLLAAPQPLADVERVLEDLQPAVPRPRAHRGLRALS